MCRCQRGVCGKDNADSAREIDGEMNGAVAQGQGVYGLTGAGRG